MAILTMPDSREIRTVCPRTLKPISDMAINAETTGISARIMMYWVYSVVTSVDSSLMATQACFGESRISMTREIKFIKALCGKYADYS